MVRKLETSSLLVQNNVTNVKCVTMVENREGGGILGGQKTQNSKIRSSVSESFILLTRQSQRRPHRISNHLKLIH